MTRAYSVLHVITGLDVGGAELALARLVEGLCSRGVANVVVSMQEPGVVAARIRAAGVTVETLGLRRGTFHPRALTMLRALIARTSPDVIQTWMYHADLLGTVARGRNRPPSLVWSVRASNVDMRHYSMLSALTRRACVWLSSRPDAVLANSEAGARFHQSLGYRARRWAVIANGIDVEAFRPDDDDRQRLRTSLAVPPDGVAIGLMGRIDPMKGHPVFLDAAAALLRSRPVVHVVMAGHGATPDAEPFRAWLNTLGDARHRVHLLGRREDMASLQRAIDIGCSASLFGEGFPNVVAEAMASGTAVVATDVGDAAHVVEACGIVVQPGRADDLAAACLALVDDAERRRQLGCAGRARIVEHFSLERTLDEHDRFYRDLIGATTAS